MTHEQPSLRYVLQSSHATSKRLDARHPVALASHIPAEFRYESDGCLQGGQRFRQNGPVVDHTIQGLPMVILAFPKVGHKVA